MFFLFISGFVFSQNLKIIRESYIQSNSSVSKAVSFNEEMSKFKSSKDPVIRGYYAGSVLLISKFEKKLKDKKELFKQGVTLLETEINKNSQSVELRLIRLSIQENVPKITGYKKNIDEDKQFLIKSYSSLDVSLKEHLRKFIKQSKSFTEVEKSKF